ncbi:aldo/keto reductase [Haliangium sp.]|uniref:aldo/keto reductase n=1 Tax=Haliangium sp. TaxID=2663208 RepID=UPI003D0D57FD
MRTQPLGASGIEASVVGLGAWAIGGWMWGGTEEADAIRAIHASIDAGVTLIDTAAVYGFGASETLVGKAVADRRDRVVVATKCGLVWDAEVGEYFFDSEGKRIHKCLAPSSIRTEVERSLRRLGVDVIDLYQTHWQDATTPIADTMGTLMDLKAEGKIRAVGVSNARPEHLDAYRAVGPVDSDQESYNMLDRRVEAKTLPYCSEHGIAVLAYSPMARGLLTGKVTPERVFSPGDHRAESAQFTVEHRARVAALLDRCRPVAERHDIGLAQLAVAWVLARPGLTHALVGARNPEQAVDNARAGAVELSEQDLSEIAAALADYAG